MQGRQAAKGYKNCLFTRRKEELSIEHGCLLWGTRVILPMQLRTREIHQGHLSINHMVYHKLLSDTMGQHSHQSSSSNFLSQNGIEHVQ